MPEHLSEFGTSFVTFGPRLAVRRKLEMRPLMTIALTAGVGRDDDGLRCGRMAKSDGEGIQLSERAYPVKSAVGWSRSLVHQHEPHTRKGPGRQHLPAD